MRRRRRSPTYSSRASRRAFAVQRPPASMFEMDVSPNDIKTYVARLKEMKNLRSAAPISAPSSLMKLSTKCILSNASRFLTFDTIFQGHTNNPFAYLPRGLAKQLINESRLFKSVESKSDRLCLVLQLLNPQITEYSQLWDCMSAASQATIFRHLLQNCPKMQKVDVSLHIWEDFFFLPRSRPVDIFQMMGRQWPNLTFLKITEVNHKENCDDIIEMISRHLPALSELEICLNLNTLTMKGVKYMTQMDKLNYLGVDLRNCSGKENFSLFVNAVGQLPSIKEFAILDDSFILANRDYNRFVDAYGQVYPRKSLTLKAMCIGHDIKHPWPDCLTLEELYIKDDSFLRMNSLSCKPENKSPNTYNNLLAGKCFPTKANIEGVESGALYSLVEKFGPADLVDLKAITGFSKEPLDVCRLLAACPKLKRVNIVCKELPEKSKFTTTTNQFQNFESFDISIKENINDRRQRQRHPQISKLFRNYLVGSRKLLKTFALKKLEELDDVLWVLDQERRTCLDQVEEVVFERSFDFCKDDSIKKKALMLVLLLAMRSPNLKKVEMNQMFHNQLLPEWYLNAFRDLGIPLTPDGIEEESSSESSDDDDDEYDSCSEEDSDCEDDNVF